MALPIRKRKRKFPIAAESVGVVNPKMDQLKSLNPAQKPLSDRMYAEIDMKKAFRSVAEVKKKRKLK